MSDNVPMKTDPNGVATLAGHIKELISSAKTAKKERKEESMKRQDHFAAQAATHGGTGGMQPEHVLKALRMTLTHDRNMQKDVHAHTTNMLDKSVAHVGTLGGQNTSIKAGEFEINHTPSPVVKPAAKPRTRAAAPKTTTAKPAASKATVAKPKAAKVAAPKTTRTPKA